MRDVSGGGSDRQQRLPQHGQYSDFFGDESVSSYQSLPWLLHIMMR
jgi:hypothetical protein